MKIFFLLAFAFCTLNCAIPQGIAANVSQDELVRTEYDDVKDITAVGFLGVSWNAEKRATSDNSYSSAALYGYMGKKPARPEFIVWQFRCLSFYGEWQWTKVDTVYFKFGEKRAHFTVAERSSQASDSEYVKGRYEKISIKVPVDTFIAIVKSPFICQINNENFDIKGEKILPLQNLAVTIPNK